METKPLYKTSNDVPLLVTITCNRCGRKVELHGIGYAEPHTGQMLCAGCINELNWQANHTEQVKPSETKQTTGWQHPPVYNISITGSE